ncbi:hypothetical protein SYNPS1DRAFT_3762, partial [Syncephalis pseudoplumigaleata]
PHYEFANFYEAPIRIDGVQWRTTEHYFQAQKFAHHPKLCNEIRLAGTARAAFAMARRYDRHKRTDWEQCKEDIMYTALQAKFQQHAWLDRKLYATGHKLLVEHTRNDRYWGDGGDGSGKNRLGVLLMKVR